MLTVERVKTCNWEAAVRGMRNPMNSWSLSDTTYTPIDVGHNDGKLMRSLVQAGPDHAKFLRMIIISMDIIAPEYWYPQFDAYKVGVTRNSCSKMHKLTAKKFELSDFSHERLDPGSLNLLSTTIKTLNHWRIEYLHATDKGQREYCWWQMMQLLPMSYNQRSTVTLNYQVARNMYHARKDHRLGEWRQLCEAFEQLPCSELITM